VGIVIVYDHGAFVIANFVVPTLIAVGVCWWRWRRKRG
jgi:hypothetical protein